MNPLFKLGQRVKVFPRTWALRRWTGCEGVVDTIELDEDDSTLLYRVKLFYEPGQGYPYYAVELRAA